MDAAGIAKDAISKKAASASRLAGPGASSRYNRNKPCAFMAFNINRRASGFGVQALACPGKHHETVTVPGQICLPSTGRRCSSSRALPKNQGLSRSQKRNLTNEILRPFPRVALGDDNARRTAVLLRQRLAVPFVAIITSSSRQTASGFVRGIAVVALEQKRAWPRASGFTSSGDGEESDPLEFHIELAPGGDAMEVAHVLELRQRQELFPVSTSPDCPPARRFSTPTCPT